MGVVVDLLWDERSDAEVAAALEDAHRAVGAAQAGLLGLICEHDRRGLWRASGAVSEERFLVGAFAVSGRTARDLVRVAHAVERNPELGRDLADGDVCWDQLVPLVEVMGLEEPGSTDPLGPFDEPQGGSSPPAPDDNGGGEPSPEPDRLGGGSPDPQPAGGASSGRARDLAGRLDAGQLASMARAMRRRKAAEVAGAHRRRRVTVSRVEGGVHVEMDLFDDAAAVVLSALDEYLRALDPDPVTGRYERVEQSMADAVEEFAHAWLSGRERATDRPAVIVHADVRVFAGEDGWAETAYGPLGAETARRLACYCHLLTCADSPDGDPLHLGRSQRSPTWQLAETVRRRDGGCRFPGCRRTRWVHTHHIREWDAHHGLTDYENLCCLCRRHHRLVHEGGWKLTGDPRGQLSFTSPDGHTFTTWPNNATRPQPEDDIGTAGGGGGGGGGPGGMGPGGTSGPPPDPPPSAPTTGDVDDAQLVLL